MFDMNVATLLSSATSRATSVQIHDFKFSIKKESTDVPSEYGRGMTAGEV